MKIDLNLGVEFKLDSIIFLFNLICVDIFEGKVNSVVFVLTTLGINSLLNLFIF